jgi:hypothetical protein
LEAERLVYGRLQQAHRFLICDVEMVTVSLGCSQGVFVVMTIITIVTIITTVVVITACRTPFCHVEEYLGFCINWLDFHLSGLCSPNI